MESKYDSNTPSGFKLKNTKISPGLPFKDRIKNYTYKKRHLFKTFNNEKQQSPAAKGTTESNK